MVFLDTIYQLLFKQLAYKVDYIIELLLPDFVYVLILFLSDNSYMDLWLPHEDLLGQF